MNLGELTDAQWRLVSPLLPERRGPGRPRADDRQTLNGILWVLRTGARWKDLPRELGSPSRCHRRLQKWQEEGVWERIWMAFVSALDEGGRVDWSRAFLDGTFVPAKRGEPQ